MPGEAPPSGYSPPPSGGTQYGTPPQAGGYQPPGGYPSQGGYPPQGGYPAAQPGVPPPGYASADDKNWALIAHFGGALGMFISFGWLGWVAPLIALLGKGNQSPTIRQHALAALNFQLLWSIIAVAGTIIAICLTFIVIGLVLYIIPAVSWAVGTIFGIIAGMRANEGQLYRYPMTVTIVK
jgi:uncharacterized Tic20 family protein